MSDFTYTYKPHYSRRPFIRQFDTRQISFLLMIYHTWRRSRTDRNYYRVREELSRMFNFSPHSSQISTVLAELNQARPNYRSFAGMYDDMNLQIEDVLDQFRERFNQGSPEELDDEEYNSYQSS